MKKNYSTLKQTELGLKARRRNATDECVNGETVKSGKTPQN